MMMVDFLTVEVPDPVGLPVNSGHMVRVKPDGSVEWATAQRLCVEGSWSSNMTFRCIASHYTTDDDDGRTLANGRFGRSGLRESGLEISGNPAKFLQGHNLFGSDDVTGLLQSVVDKAKGAIWPELPFADGQADIDFSAGLISRIDLTASHVLDRAEDVLPWLKAAEERVWCPYRGRGVMDAGGSTLYFGRAAKGKRAKDWQIKIYSKGRDITAHPLPRPAFDVPGLLDEVNRTIRFELTLRTAELKRLGLQKVGDWAPAKVREIWELYMAKLDFGPDGGALNLDVVDVADLGLKPRHAHALAAWKAGNDMRAGVKPATFYRLRKELKALTGIDIASAVPRSNVVPLRRVVTAQPASRPLWADHLTEALVRAA